MKKAILAGVAALVIAGSTAVYAHPHHLWSRDRVQLSQQDRTAIADARIAAVHAGLTLTPDQEKLWPPVEKAIRDFAKLRIDRADAKMQAKKESKNEAKNDDAEKQAPVDQVARLRAHADRMAETAAALKKIADAADPLYKTLDDGQKRRLMVLTRMNHGFGMGSGWHHHHFDRGGDWSDHSKDRDGDSDHHDQQKPGRL
ncbi:Spy/CpxP family protein refolding chaperone [Nitrobacter vulgaris]|jgi:hypothetical protein|uniref:LTXXQ motif family protein n=1 Tax=Nitrobacter vulgaris TaxID=29421 RepID=A0A1V4HWN6_NITVU|nr:Spy/CpxP family protein refolding chaperone [Nitrobacter vulgaris]OPH82387.1 hypothetical protein B2M20_12430 [Nitrobacter vulgaris]